MQRLSAADRFKACSPTDLQAPGAPVINISGLDAIAIGRPSASTRMWYRNTVACATKP